MAKAADSSQTALNQSAQGDYVPPSSLSHDDQVSHALLTDPATGNANQGFENSLNSILAGLKNKKPTATLAEAQAAPQAHADLNPTTPDIPEIIGGGS